MSSLSVVPRLSARLRNRTGRDSLGLHTTFFREQFMLKPFAIAAALTTFGAAAAYAQTTPPTPASPAPTVQMQPQAQMSGSVSADTRKLIGRNIKNMQNETIGEIEAIYLGADGKIDSVIAGVGGFLGINQREVRLAWSDLKIENGGEKVTVDMTKDQIKAMPPYTYKETTYRGQIYTDSGLWTDKPGDRRAEAPRPVDNRMNERPTRTDRPADDRATAAPPVTNPPATNPPVRTTSRDYNAAGHVSGESVLKASVRNANNEKVGEIEDVYLDAKGQIQTVVVSVGGFLGMGSKHVEVKWSDLQVKRDGDTIAVVTSWTKDSLKAMPDFKYERQQALQPAPAERK
jgi:sporulation protein YlmC with PRC-barrel domain